MLHEPGRRELVAVVAHGPGEVGYAADLRHGQAIGPYRSHAFGHRRGDARFSQACLDPILDDGGARSQQREGDARGRAATAC